MHVAFLTSEYPPLRSGGIGTSVRNLARELVRQGHRASVVGWGQEAEFEDAGVAVRFLGGTRVPKAGWLLNRRLLQRELNRMVREEGVEVVEAPDWCGPSAGMRLGCPLVVRCHGTDTYFGSLLGYRPRPSVRWAERAGLRRAHSVVAVSRFTADVTRRLFGLRREIGVIPNGIDVSQFRPAEPAEVDGDLILYFGSIVRKKGVLDLCRAFSLIAERRPRVRLRFVGRDAADSKTGSPSTWALCEAQLSGAARARTEYLGAQPYETIQGHIRAAALCAFPSYAEAMPLSWMEAMACAKPVVAYDIGWAREVVEHERTGLLVKPGRAELLAESLERLLDDPALRRRMAAAARTRAESLFSAPVAAGRSLEWYQSIVGGGALGPIPRTIPGLPSRPTHPRQG